MREHFTNEPAVEGSEPGKEAFDFPSTTIPAQKASVLSEVLAAASMRGKGA